MPAVLKRYEIDVQERFCIMTVDGRQNDHAALRSLAMRGLVTRKDAGMKPQRRK
jgi:hypothetical protein